MNNCSVLLICIWTSTTYKC